MLFAAAFAATTVLGLTMVAARGLVMLPFGLLGVAGAIAYTLPPVRAAYRPVAGEAIAFGCLMLCVVGAAVLQHGAVDAELLLAAVAVSAYAVGMLMMHHFLDYEADRSASPPKRTTIVALGLEDGPPLRDRVVRRGDRRGDGRGRAPAADAAAGRRATRSAWRRTCAATRTTSRR